MTEEVTTPQSESGSGTSGSAPTRRGETEYVILLWLPQARVWQTLGYVKVASREESLEQGLTLEGCPAASERPALSAVPLRYWQPFIASPPPPPEGHEWQPFVPQDPQPPVEVED